MRQTLSIVLIVNIPQPVAPQSFISCSVYWP